MSAKQVEVEMLTDDEEGFVIKRGHMAVVPRIGDTMYGPRGAPGPWLVTSVFWTRPFIEQDEFDASGKPQKAAVHVRLDQRYDTATEGDLRDG